jgi:cell division protein ZapE
MAENYRLLAIKDVYMMGEQQDAVAKRFMHLVDALYDNNVALALSIEAPLQALYQGRRLQQNFIRTLSRLYEMTSGQSSVALR